MAMQRPHRLARVRSRVCFWLWWFGDGGSDKGELGLGRVGFVGWLEEGWIDMGRGDGCLSVGYVIDSRGCENCRNADDGSCSI